MSDDLYLLMLKCWNAQSTKRPSFENIYQDLMNMKLNFAKKQRFQISFDSKDDSIEHAPAVSPFRRQSLGMRASIRKLVRSVSSKRSTSSWNNDTVVEESIPIYTSLMQKSSSSSKISIQVKKDARVNEVITKVVLKLGLPEKDTYKYSIVEMFDPQSGMRRSQPALNTSLESCTPYVTLLGLIDQPVILRAAWQHKSQTKFMLCPRGSILRVMELHKLVKDGIPVGPLPYQTRGYLLQSTGEVSGRNSIMWRKVWAVLDGISLGLFEDEDCEERWENVLTVQHACVSESRNDMFTLTDGKNVEHTFQGDDKEDAYRWVEGINAASLAKAPPSSKLEDCSVLHAGKVLIFSSEEAAVNFGVKQITLSKDELYFNHNGERLSVEMKDVSAIDIIAGSHSGVGDPILQPNGLKLSFSDSNSETNSYSLFPDNEIDFYAWSTAFHKSAIFLNKHQVIQNSNLNELKKEYASLGGT